MSCPVYRDSAPVQDSKASGELRHLNGRRQHVRRLAAVGVIALHTLRVTKPSSSQTSRLFPATYPTDGQHVVVLRKIRKRRESPASGYLF